MARSKEKQKEYNKMYYLKNKEKRLKYDQENKEAIRERQKLYKRKYYKDPENRRILTIQQLEYQRNKYAEDWEYREKKLQMQRTLKERDPEKYFERLERQKAYYHAKKQLKKRD